MTSALLRVNLETLYDDEGLPLFSHIAGEAITLFKCKPVEVQIRHNEKHCCSEFSIWVGTNFSTPALASPRANALLLLALPGCVITLKPLSLMLEQNTNPAGSRLVALVLSFNLRLQKSLFRYLQTKMTKSSLDVQVYTALNRRKNSRSFPW